MIFTEKHLLWQTKTGGMSGPAVKPVAVRMVYQVAQAVKLPIIGMGGIATAEDALEFIMAGATAVSVGTANFFNPYATTEIVDGLAKFMEQQKVEDINQLIGYCKIVVTENRIEIHKRQQRRLKNFFCCLVSGKEIF